MSEAMALPPLLLQASISCEIVCTFPHPQTQKLDGIAQNFGWVQTCIIELLPNNFIGEGHIGRNRKERSHHCVRAIHTQKTTSKDLVKGVLQNGCL